MATVTNLGQEDIDKFNAFASITTATFTSGNLTTLVETWGQLTRTLTLTYSSGNIATLTTVWSR